MDMREAFENYVLSLKPFQVLTPHQAWQAACEWQKQKDVEFLMDVDYLVANALKDEHER